MRFYDDKLLIFVIESKWEFQFLEVDNYQFTESEEEFMKDFVLLLINLNLSQALFNFSCLKSSFFVFVDKNRCENFL